MRFNKKVLHSTIKDCLRRENFDRTGKTKFSKNPVQFILNGNPWTLPTERQEYKEFLRKSIKLYRAGKISKLPPKQYFSRFFESLFTDEQFVDAIDFLVELPVDMGLTFFPMLWRKRCVHHVDKVHTDRVYNHFLRDKGGFKGASFLTRYGEEAFNRRPFLMFEHLCRLEEAGKGHTMQSFIKDVPIFCIRGAWKYIQSNDADNVRDDVLRYKSEELTSDEILELQAAKVAHLNL